MKMMCCRHGSTFSKKIKEIKTIKIEDGSYRKIKMIDQTKEVGSGGFKRDVVTTDSIQHISVQFVQDKCDLLNSFQVGEAL
jgi:hypothetical protein